MQLLDLPTEVVDLIVEKLICGHTYAIKIEQLRLLRQVCKHFAGSHAVLRNLFRNVQLIADLKRIAAFNTRTLERSGIAPFVRHVTFIPPLYNFWDFEEFKDFFKIAQECRYDTTTFRPIYVNPLRRSNRLNDARSNYTRYKHSERRLKAAFNEYQAGHACALACIDDQIIHEEWLEMLKSFSRCTSFRFALVDYSNFDNELAPTIPECYTAPVQDPDRLHYPCDEDKASVVANVFSTEVVEIMGMAGCAIETLVLGQTTMHWKIGWDQTIGLEKLDVSRLRHLTVEPSLPQYDDEGHLQMTRLMQKDIHSLFKRAANTLETFDCKRAAVLAWQGTPVALPQLRKLVLGPCEIHPQFFTEWLKQLPKLESIRTMAMLFRDESLEAASSIDWEAMFKVIRDHETLRIGRLEFDAGEVEGEYDLVFDRTERWDLSEEEMEGFRSEAERDERYSRRSLESWLQAYICGKIEWCNVMTQELTDGIGWD